MCAINELQRALKSNTPLPAIDSFLIIAKLTTAAVRVTLMALCCDQAENQDVLLMDLAEFEERLLCSRRAY